jgi:hypothetical protein
MRKVMVNLFVIRLVSNFCTIFKDAITKREFMTRLVQYSSKVERPYISTQIITKHVFLTTIVGNNSQTLSRQKVWLLNVHLQNLAKVAHCRELMNSAWGFLWSLEEESKCLTFKIKALVFIMVGFWNAMTFSRWVGE